MFILTLKIIPWDLKREGRKGRKGRLPARVTAAGCVRDRSVPRKLRFFFRNRVPGQPRALNTAARFSHALLRNYRCQDYREGRPRLLFCGRICWTHPRGPRFRLASCVYDSVASERLTLPSQLCSSREKFLYENILSEVWYFYAELITQRLTVKNYFVKRSDNSRLRGT